jgi:hypothetical protein
MPTQEEELALISTAASQLTASVLLAKGDLETQYALFVATITRVNELNLVDNTPDALKIVSNDVVQYLTGFQALLVSGFNVKNINGESILGAGDLVVARGQVEVPLLDYSLRASLRAPVTPVPETGDVVNIPHLGHYQYTAVADYAEIFVDDDEMVFEAIHPSTSAIIGQWSQATPALEWTESQKLFENAVLWERWEDEELRHNTY